MESKKIYIIYVSIFVHQFGKPYNLNFISNKRKKKNTNLPWFQTALYICIYGEHKGAAAFNNRRYNNWHPHNNINYNQTGNAIYNGTQLLLSSTGLTTKARLNAEFSRHTPPLNGEYSPFSRAHTSIHLPASSELN